MKSKSLSDGILSPLATWRPLISHTGVRVKACNSIKFETGSPELKIVIRMHTLCRHSLVPRPFLYGRDEKGKGRKGLVNNSPPTPIREGSGNLTSVDTSHCCYIMLLYDLDLFLVQFRLDYGLLLDLHTYSSCLFLCDFVWAQNMQKNRLMKPFSLHNKQFMFFFNYSLGR